ncbi:hypothetical protein EC991_006614, partial [Linnemannia zychae]
MTVVKLQVYGTFFGDIRLAKEELKRVLPGSNGFNVGAGGPDGGAKEGAEITATVAAGEATEEVGEGIITGDRNSSSH